MEILTRQGQYNLSTVVRLDNVKKSCVYMATVFLKHGKVS